MLRPLNPVPVLVLGLYTILWGLWIVNPFWEVFTQADIYSAMTQLGGEYFWGSIAVLAGTVTVYGAIKGRPPYLFYGASTAGWHWFTIAIMYFMGDWQNTGGITSLMLAVWAACIYLNVKVNYQHATPKD